jgi:hypothetical protein
MNKVTKALTLNMKQVEQREMMLLLSELLRFAAAPQGPIGDGGGGTGAGGEEDGDA